MSSLQLVGFSLIVVSGIAAFAWASLRFSDGIERDAEEEALSFTSEDLRLASEKMTGR